MSKVLLDGVVSVVDVLFVSGVVLVVEKSKKVNGILVGISVSFLDAYLVMTILNWAFLIHFREVLGKSEVI